MIKDWNIITRRIIALAQIRWMIIKCKTDMEDWQLEFKFTSKSQMPCVWLTKASKYEIPFCLLPENTKKSYSDPTKYSWSNDLKIIAPTERIKVTYKYSSNTIHCKSWKWSTTIPCWPILKESSIQDVPFFTFLWYVKNV